MSQVINTNILSLNAQRNLTNSAATLQTSLQRLSSGLRINSAKDDAAGLAISERFTTQIRGMNQAVRNANDGISLAQSAEGALGEIGNNLQRIRELAVQASNATNSENDRKALNSEVQQRLGEIQRVASQTEFNGTKLLDGSFSGLSFQVGANAGQLITVSDVADVQTGSLGGTKFAGGSLTVADPTLGTDFEIAAMKINDVEINAVSVDGGAVDATKAAAVEKLVEAINAKSAESGVSAKAGTGDDAGKVLLESTLVDQVIKFSETPGGAGISASSAEVLADVVETFASAIDVSSFADAQRAIALADQALTDVNSSRASLGAIQNRFESVVANLSTAVENLSASRSRILDTDFAAETAALTRGQILQQAGTAMLAQANAAPQNVLSLLR